MKKNHEVVRFENGTATLRDLALGEGMHSSIGPWEEAMRVHVGQADLPKRFSSPLTTPLVIYDLGMGLAANALGALELYKKSGSTRPIHIVSFERDPSGLSLALREIQDFPFLAPWRSAAFGLLERGLWLSEDHRIRWELRTGDFPPTSLETRPEVIFFDFYSPKAQPSLWSVQVFETLFQSLAETCAPGPVLTTYSAATAIRVSMLLSGFCVGSGLATSAKRETTVAARNVEDLHSPLDHRWLERLKRSERPFPPDLTHDDRDRLYVRISDCAQFHPKK